MKIKSHKSPKQKGDIYVGRKKTSLQLGNPFSHKPNNAAKFQVNTLKESLECYEQWLNKITQNLLAGREDQLANWEKQYAEQFKDLIIKIKNNEVKSLTCWCVDRDYNSKMTPECHAEILYKKALAVLEIFNIISNF